MTEELAKKYQKKSDKQHVLDNPDTYIGSIENVTSNSFIFDNNSKKIIENIGFLRNNYSGNLIITFNVNYPEKISKEIQEALNKIL